jgi:L-ascorbate metabolism protein UlaG (beta-lactamase superfamily)
MKRRTVAAVMAAVAAAALVAAVAGVPGCVTVNPYYAPSKAHHRQDGFQNIDPAAAMPRPYSEFLRWQRERMSLTIPEPKLDLSPYVPDLGYIGNNRTEFAVTWIGHATALLQLGGVNVLTDPMFSERASPVQWMGPRRRQPPGVLLRELPHIDVVVISHNHYDHLDAASVKALNAQAGGPPLFVVPLGVERWLADEGIKNAKALDWWDSIDIRGARIHMVPVQHWSGRAFADRMKTLWGGYVIEAGGKRAFFTGDTGYSAAHFMEIGERLGPIDLALIPIGGYEPRWFMGKQHVNPEEAVQIAQDLKARRALGIHWGTFQLTDEPLDQALTDLAAALKKLGLTERQFFVLRHGETRRLLD